MRRALDEIVQSASHWSNLGDLENLHWNHVSRVNETPAETISRFFSQKFGRKHDCRVSHRTPFHLNRAHWRSDVANSRTESVFVCIAIFSINYVDDCICIRMHSFCVVRAHFPAQVPIICVLFSHFLYLTGGRILDFKCTVHWSFIIFAPLLTLAFFEYFFVFVTSHTHITHFSFHIFLSFAISILSATETQFQINWIQAQIYYRIKFYIGDGEVDEKNKQGKRR